MSSTAVKTQVLSTRVPVDVMNTIDSLAEKEGVNRSQWLTRVVAEKKSDQLFQSGGQLQTRTIPLEVQEMLTAAGVATVGILGYNVIGKLMTDAKDKDGKPMFSDAEVDFISIILAVGLSMAGYGVIKSLMREK